MRFRSIAALAVLLAACSEQSPVGGRAPEGAPPASARADQGVAGSYTIVASGNENGCNVSSAGAPDARTVNAVDRHGARAGLGDYGGCTDVYAPDVDVTGTWLNGATSTISGTSMDSPRAAGAGALYRATYGDAASSTIVGWMISGASPSYLSGNPTGTPSRVLYRSTL